MPRLLNKRKVAALSLAFLIAASITVAYYVLFEMEQPRLEKKPAIGSKGSRKLIIGLPGIFCPACEQSIKTTLGRTDGVIAVDASFNTKTAVVIYDPAKITKERIVEIIKQLGYNITKVTD